jgi:hypothetical protein
MPKQPSSQACLFKSWISKFPEGVFTTDGKVIFCQACQISEKFYEVLEKNPHLETIKKIGRVISGEIVDDLQMAPLISKWHPVDDLQMAPPCCLFIYKKISLVID